MSRGCWIAAGLALALPGAGGEALAQALPTPSLAIELTSDQRRRGLSWSDGRTAIELFGVLPIGDRIELNAAATSLRGGARHGGADVGVDLAARYQRDAGGWRLSAGLLGHFFVGRPALDYVELEGRASYLTGPAQIDFSLAYAPSQAAIGGDNLHLGVGIAVAVPGTPLTLHGSAGRSSGDAGDPARAGRLRPEGVYWDYRLGADHVVGRYTAGLRFSTTSGASRGGGHAGARLVGHVRLEL